MAVQRDDGTQGDGELVAVTERSVVRRDGGGAYSRQLLPTAVLAADEEGKDRGLVVIGEEEHAVDNG